MASTWDQRLQIISSAVTLARETSAEKVLLFLNSVSVCRKFLSTDANPDRNIVLVIPRNLKIPDSDIEKNGCACIRYWSGNQSRFSRIKYALLQGVLSGILRTDSRTICVLGPWEKPHLDTIVVHDLGLSWSEDFPFEPYSLAEFAGFEVVMAVLDIALDIGALGREGKAVGTIFVIGDTEVVLEKSHQAVFNPFKGYPKRERTVTRAEVVESIKELALLDGAFVISESGILEAAGRHLDARSIRGGRLRGLGSRHRAAAGITKRTRAVAIVVSESTGGVTIFVNGKIISSLEPVISRRLE